MYDNNGEELSQEEIKKIQNETRLKSGLKKMASDFSNGFREGAGWNKEDVDNIKNRKGKNEGHRRPKDEDDEDNASAKDKSSLEEKEGLEKKEEKNSKDSKDNKDNKDDKKGSDKKTDLKSKEKKEGFLKGKWSKLVLKVKIALIALGVFLAVAIIVVISSALTIAIDAFKNAITNFFGISDKTTIVNGKEVEGLYSDKYLYDEDGNVLNAEDLVNNLKASNQCGGTNGAARAWNNTIDAITNFLGIEGMSVCKFMREIKRQTDGTDLDRSLIISTVFYGYATQASNSQYNNASDVPDDKLDATNQYEILEAVLKDTKNGLTKSDFDDIVENMQIDPSYKRYYYTWEVDDSEEGKIVGKCEKSYANNGQYSLDKWKVFMRYGENEARRFDELGMLIYAYNSSDEECIGKKTEEELMEVLNNAASNSNGQVDVVLDGSVTKAISELKDTNTGALTPYYKYADIESKQMDDVSPFDYRNGFAYTHFPGYQKSDNDSKISQTYDNVFTPKYVETTIQEIISKKADLNSVLLFEDPDNPNSSITRRRGSKVGSGKCGDYVSASYDEMQVKLTDCHGKYITTVSFEDYIIGVANGEVSNSGDNYVLSQMLAAISYSLKRHNNYTKGSTITMRSGTCDQVYCSMMEGCHSIANPDVCRGCASFYIGGSKKYPNLYPKYQAYYEKAIAYLVVSNGTPHNAHYVSDIQNGWKKKADQGMFFTQIIQEEYEDEGAEVIKCSDLNSPVETPKTEDTETKVGNKKTDKYPNVSADLGNYYGFAYKDLGENKRIEINPDWIEANLTKIKPKCSDTTFANMEFTVHTKAVGAYQKAFDGVCKLLTEGVKISNGDTCKYTMSDLKDGTAFIARKTTNGAIDIHSYGIAQDWNYSQKYTINGKTYTPYNTRELSEYLDFVNAIGGNEENCQNVNYILWLKAYKDAGFEWGGNFGRNGNSGQYDGKLFQIKYE